MLISALGRNFSNINQDLLLRSCFADFLLSSLQPVVIGSACICLVSEWQSLQGNIPIMSNAIVFGTQKRLLCFLFSLTNSPFGKLHDKKKAFFFSEAAQTVFEVEVISSELA